MIARSVRSWPSLLWVLFVPLVSLVLLGGCEGDYRPRAGGPEGEITVVMDSSLWTGAPGKALRDNVAPWVETLPISERFFQLRHLELASERTFDRVKDLKNCHHRGAPERLVQRSHLPPPTSLRRRRRGHS